MPFNDKPFEPALTTPCTWSIGENRFDESGNWPAQWSMFIPKDSIHDLIQHLMNIADHGDVKTGKVYDYRSKMKVEKQGYYIRAKGKGDPEDPSVGSFGNFNPPALKAEESAAPAPAELPANIPF